MNTEIQLIESVLFGSPYSGCRCFSGWPKQPCQKMPVQTSWPSPVNAPGALACVDRVQRPSPGPQNVQQVAFRPSRPYPRYVLGAGGTPLVPPPCKKAAPRPPIQPYSIARGMRFPSTSGAWNTRITSGISGNLPDTVICSIGQFSQHNLGYD